MSQAGSVGPAKRPKRDRKKKKGKQGFIDSLLDDLPALGLLAAAAGLMLSLASKQRKPKLYEVQEGDTLCSIAACLNTSARRLYDANKDRIADPNVIYPGAHLRLT